MKKKFDFTTLVGLLFAVVVVCLSIVWGKWDAIGANLKKFYDIPSVFICVTGPVAAILVAFEWSTIASVPSVLKNAFLCKEIPKTELIKLFIDMARQSRRQGLLSLEGTMDGLRDKYIRSGIQMTIDGVNDDTIRDIMGLEIDQTNERHKKCIQLFRMWANLAPSLGMLGTFIGLVQMMSAFNDVDKFGAAFATVIVTSFYGVVLANLVLGPLANKLDIKNQNEINRMEMILEGIIGLSKGMSPSVLEDSLKPFLSPAERLKYEVIHLKDVRNANLIGQAEKTKDKKNGKEVA